MRVLVFIERSARSRYWEGSIPRLPSVDLDVLFASVREYGPLHERLESHGVRTFSLKCRTSWDYPGAVLRLARLIRQHRVDVIHACESIPATIGGLAGLFARRAKRMFHRQHCVFDGPQALFSRMGSRLAQMVVACSEAAGQHAHDIDGVARSRIRVVYNGTPDLRAVSQTELAALRDRLRIAPGAKVISVIAHLRPEKGHRTLLEAMPAVGNAFAAPPHLVVVGSGSEERALKERARTIRDTMVHFVGHQDDVAPWFALADVVAMPSYREPFGISAIEAMAGSRPLVASRVDGLIEVVEDGVSGLLVHPRDAGELASGLLRLLQHPDLAATIAANGYRRFRECFTIDGMVQMWRKCYEELVGDARLAERA